MKGELVRGNNDLYDQMDEIEGYKAGFLFGTKDAVNMVLDNKVGEWFKREKLPTDLYRHLAGKEIQLTLNTPVAEFLKYNFNSRIGTVLRSNKNNTNMTSVKEAIDYLNRRSQSIYNKNEYYHGDFLRKRNK